MSSRANPVVVSPFLRLSMQCSSHERTRILRQSREGTCRIEFQYQGDKVEVILLAMYSYEGVVLALWELGEGQRNFENSHICPPARFRVV